MSLSLEPGERWQLVRMLYKAKVQVNLLGEMNKQQEQTEQMVALVLMACGIGLLVGEAMRQEVYRGEAEALLRSVYSAKAAVGPDTTAACPIS